jgi:hypothetical protein
VRPEHQQLNGHDPRLYRRTAGQFCHNIRRCPGHAALSFDRPSSSCWSEALLAWKTRDEAHRMVTNPCATRKIATTTPAERG